MTVLLLANDEQKQELLAYPVSDTIRLYSIKDPGDFLPGQNIHACIDLLFENTKERINWLKSLQSTLVIINAVIETLQRTDQHFIRINGWNTFLKRPVIEATFSDNRLQPIAERLFDCFNRRAEWVPDVAGFITPRVIASIINEAFFALEERVSTEAEINTAMTLGTNYPFGPFEWGKKIGFQRIYSLLDTLSREQSRYRPSSLLTQTALA